MYNHVTLLTVNNAKNKTNKQHRSTPSFSGLTSHTPLNTQQDFIQRGGWNSPNFPPPPRNLDIDYCGTIDTSCFMLLDISMCHQSVVWKVCPRLSEATWTDLNSKFSWGRGDMPPDPPSSHAHLRTLPSSCYHPVLPSPNSKSCMKPCTTRKNVGR